MKLTKVINICKSLFPMKNGSNSINILNTDSHKSFPIHYSQWRKFSKRILMYIYRLKCNEINVCHSDVQEHVSYKNGVNSTNVLYTGSHKRIPICYSQ